MATVRRRKNDERLGKLIANYQAEGLHIEAGFIQFCMRFVPRTASEEQFEGPAPDVVRRGDVHLQVLSRTPPSPGATRRGNSSIT